MHLADCTHEQHAQPILSILNEATANSTAIYDYQPRTLDSMTGWFKAKEVGHSPVLGLVSDAGELLGFASYGSFRAFPAYRYTVGHSVYVHHARRGRGLGRQLLQALVERARG